MRINRIFLKGYKRFRLNNIDQFEAEFPSNVTVIVGSNGSGKSSLLSELCPLPSVRSDFEADGRKELDITHDNKSYHLISDFSNKTSPHSFIVDGVELNVGHTTEIQYELVLKHFGLTQSIKDLIYNKVKLSKTTKAERRNLFLKINPMDLSLILESHKKTLGKIKDCKANLNLLYTKKNDLEGKMMSDEVLKNNISTREKLKQQSSLLQQLIFGLTQHVESIKVNYKDDLLYNEIIDTEEIHRTYNKIRSDILKYNCVVRGEKFSSEKEKLNYERSKLTEKKDNVLDIIETLSKEIDEFNKHLDAHSEYGSASSIAEELKTIDNILNTTITVNIEPIPLDDYPKHFDIIERVKNYLTVFMNADVTMLPVDVIYNKKSELRELNTTLVGLANNANRLRVSKEETEKEIKSLKEKAMIPSECALKCGLRSVFKMRQDLLNEKLMKYTTELEALEKDISKATMSYNKLHDELEPFIKNDLVSVFNNIKDCLNNSNFKLFKNDEELIDIINNQSMKLVADMNEIMKMSDEIHTKNKLLEKRKLLETELSTILSTADISTSFIKKELDKKNSKLTKELNTKKIIDKQLTDINNKWDMYQEYSTACNIVKELQEKYDRGERALVVKKAIEYWNMVRSKYSEIQDNIQEELRQIETILREQEMLKHTYETEIVPTIDKIIEQREVLSKIEYALSPNTGIPHSSMVKYLNTMINNVNYFLSQIWSYKMQLETVNEHSSLDYGFPLNVAGSVSKDINMLSDGQSEVIDLVWVLTILLQMKLLDKIPFYADEISRCMDTFHRGKTLSFLNSLLDSKLINQLFIINHFAAISDGFTDSNVICLNNENLSDLPSNTNEFVKIKYN